VASAAASAVSPTVRAAAVAKTVIVLRNIGCPLWRDGDHSSEGKIIDHPLRCTNRRAEMQACFVLGHTNKPCNSEDHARQANGFHVGQRRVIYDRLHGTSLLNFDFVCK
jgi:hypothetical protein